MDNPDLIYEIITHSDLDTIINLCNSSPQFNQLCQKPRVMNIINRLIEERRQMARRRLIDMLYTYIKKSDTSYMVVFDLIMDGVQNSYELIPFSDDITIVEHYSFIPGTHIPSTRSKIKNDELLQLLNFFIDNNAVFELTPYEINFNTLQSLYSDVFNTKSVTYELIEPFRDKSHYKVKIKAHDFLNNYQLQ